jgi:GNAT superfamily N-acetyltransferase
MKSTLSAIRIATPADRPAMLAIINAAFAIETFIEGTRTNDAELTSMMEKGIFLLGLGERDQIVASVYVEIKGARGYFGMLSIDPAQQGNGFSRTMVQAAEDYCREQGCTAMDLTVVSLRTELPPLYCKFGYVEKGTEEFRPSRPLKDGFKCHLIVMSKNL